MYRVDLAPDLPQVQYATQSFAIDPRTCTILEVRDGLDFSASIFRHDEAPVNAVELGLGRSQRDLFDPIRGFDAGCYLEASCFA